MVTKKQGATSASASASTSANKKTRIPVARRGGKLASASSRRQQPPTPDDSQSPVGQPGADGSSSDDDDAAVYVAPSRTPTSASSKKQVKQATIDIKGKGKARATIEEPKKQSTKKGDVFNEDNSDHAPEVQDTMPPPRSRKSRAMETPDRFRAGTPRLAPVASSSVLRTSSRARTASVGPGGPVFSSVKPVRLKTVIRTSPPRYTISDDESDSDSDFILKSRGSTGKRKRKAAVGEFEWDEQSRACIPKRERSRSRSVAFALMAKEEIHDDGDTSMGQQTDGLEEMREDAEDRSHIQASTSNILGGLHDEMQDLEADSVQSTSRKQGNRSRSPEEIEFEGNDLQQQDNFAQQGSAGEHADFPVPSVEEPMYDFGNNDGPDDNSDEEMDISIGKDHSDQPAMLSSQSGRSDEEWEASIRRIGSPARPEEPVNTLEAAAMNASMVEQDADEIMPDEKGARAGVAEEPAEMGRVASRDELEGREGSIGASLIDDSEKSGVIQGERYPKMHILPPQSGEGGTIELPDPLLAASTTITVSHGIEVTEGQVVTQTDKSLHAVKTVVEMRLILPEVARAPSELPPSSPPSLPDTAHQLQPVLAMDTDSSEDDEVPYIPHSAQKRLQLFSPAPEARISKDEAKMSKDEEALAKASLEKVASSPIRSALSPRRSATPLVQLPQDRLSSPKVVARAPSNAPRSPSPYLNIPTPTSPAGAITPGRPLASLAHLSSVQLYTANKAIDVPHISPIKLRSPSPAPNSLYARPSSVTPAQRPINAENIQSASPSISRLGSPMASANRHRTRSPSPLCKSTLPEEEMPTQPSSPSVANRFETIAARLKSLSPRPPPSRSGLRSPQGPSRLVDALQSTPHAKRTYSPPASTSASIHQMLHPSSLSRQRATPDPPSLPPMRFSDYQITASNASASVRAGLRQLRESLSVEPCSPRGAISAVKQEEHDSPVQSLGPALEVVQDQQDHQSSAQSFDAFASVERLQQVQSAGTSQNSIPAPSGHTPRLGSPAPVLPLSTRRTPTPIPAPTSGPISTSHPVHISSLNSQEQAFLPDDLASSNKNATSEPFDDGEISETDSEAEALEVERSLSRSRSLSKSPAPFRHMAMHDEVPLSPNVTIRRARSRSRSTNSTISMRSKPNTPQRPFIAGRKLSFADLGTLDSSPLSVAASVSQKSFEALDTSSEDEDDDDEDDAPRPSPAKQIAAAQLRQSQQERLRSPSTSSSEEDDRPTSALTSSPGRLLSGRNRFSHALAQALTSTPAKLLGALALTTAKKVDETRQPVDIAVPEATSEHSPPAAVQRLPPNHPPATSPSDSPASKEWNDESLFVEPGSPVGQDTNSTAADGENRMDNDPQEVSMDISMVATDGADTGDLSMLSLDTSADTSAILDAARPRSALVVPPLASKARPVRSRARNKMAVPASKTESPIRTAKRPIIASDISPISVSSSRQARSPSRQGSTTSTTSALVQVSSVDPKLAARAAAILKVHHHYIQNGTGPETDTATVNHHDVHDGEALLDELLREAEMEVSMRVPKVEEHSQEMLEDTSMSDAHNITAQQSYNLSVRRIVKSEPKSRLGCWTRQDWRSLEQSFIDERRRSAMAKEPLDIKKAVRNYLEGEEMTDADCVDEWEPEKLEIRVQALLARKEQKAWEERFKRERSHSCISSVASRAPSDFFAQEDSRMQGDDSSVAIVASQQSFFKPLRAIQPHERRYASSAEPSFPSSLTMHYNTFRRKEAGLSRLLPVPSASGFTNNPIRRAVSLNSITEVPQRVGTLYPCLTDLAIEMRPKKQMPIRGGRIAAAVRQIESMEAKQFNVLPGTSYLQVKRKASHEDLREERDNKRQRM